MRYEAKGKRGSAVTFTPMNTTLFFLKGLVAGFVIAAPVGPVGIMCIHRTITQGKPAGYVSGLGAAIADTFYGVAAAFGLSLLAAELMNHQILLRSIGGTVLCLIGLRSLITRRVPAPAAPAREKLLGDFASAFFVTLTNPLTVLTFAAVFAAIGIAEVGEKARWGAALVVGVFAGAAAWWFLLTSLAGLFRGLLSDAGVLWINRGSGAIILVFGALLLASWMGLG